MMNEMNQENVPYLCKWSLELLQKIWSGREWMMVSSTGGVGLYTRICLCAPNKWLMKGIETLDKPTKQSTTGSSLFMAKINLDKVDLEIVGGNGGELRNNYISYLRT
jgi:hypothetical protein